MPTPFTELVERLARILELPPPEAPEALASRQQHAHPRHRRRAPASKRRGRLLPPRRQPPPHLIWSHVPVGLEGSWCHGLTRKQAWQVRRMLNRRTPQRNYRPWRRALQLAGCISAVKRGVVGNRQWGQHLYHIRQGKLGQRQLRQHLAMRGVSVREHMTMLSRKGVEARRRKRRAAAREAYLKQHPHQRSWRIRA